ncbi:hypothetical protein ANCCAN_20874, partial [Ancylostoma caninum]
MGIFKKLLCVVFHLLYLTLFYLQKFVISDQLQNYFSRYGQVRSVNMFFDAETGLHRGFASVTFENPESATRAMQQRPHVIDGDRIDLEPYIPMLSKKKDIVL